MPLNPVNSPKPFISVGLPTYNRPELTRLALKSCLEQDYPHFEVIISDDSQGDDIRRIAGSFGSDKVRYIKNEPPLGIPAKLNDLVARAKGPWMVLLGDDDLFDPGYLSAVAGILEQHPDASLVHTRCRAILENGEFFRDEAPQKSAMTPAQFMNTLFKPWYEFRVSITGFVFPVETMKRLGGFRDYYQGHFIDNVAWAMLGTEGTSYFDERTLVSIRENPAALSRNFIPDYRLLIRSKEDITRVILGIFDRLERDGADKAEIGEGRARFMEFLLGDSQVFLDRICVHVLKQNKNSVHAEIEDIYLTVHNSEVPFLSTPRFKRLLSFYRSIAGWPLPLRMAVLGLFRKGTRAVKTLTGPRTLAEKAHHLRPKNS